MSDIFRSERKYIYFLSVFFLLWIILFEFILSPNQILPRPSITLVSIFSLFKDYQFLINLLSSISAIYFSFIVACLFFWIFRRFLINNKNFFGYLSFFLKWITSIIPGILIGLFLIFWFPDSEIVKYIFVFLISITFLVNKLESELKKVNSEFIDAAVSLGGGQNFIIEKVCWKAVEPGIADSLNEIHFYLWSMLLVFEIIKGGSGIGSVLKMAIMYKDLAVLFSLIIIIGVIIFLGTIIIKYFRSKYIFWSLN
jgi:ABC-type nitrate/sulfonate/bicarbonate transport system permease component